MGGWPGWEMVGAAIRLMAGTAVLGDNASAGPELVGSVNGPVKGGPDGAMLVFDLNRFGDDLSRGYEHHILDEGKQLQLIILVTFLLTFTTVRIITHAIRAGRWKRVFHNLSSPGGTHFHHLVPGIILLLVSGYFGIGLEDDIYRVPFAVLFGAGAALTLDEFALWLHLEDVYWAREGRQSVDAVVIMATLIGLGILGDSFWVDIGRSIGRLLGWL